MPSHPTPQITAHFEYESNPQSVALHGQSKLKKQSNILHVKHKILPG